MSFTSIFKKLFGTKSDRDMKQLMPKVNEILKAYETIDKLSDDELRAKCDELKEIIRKAIAQDEQRIAEIKVEMEKNLSLAADCKLDILNHLTH